MLSAAKRDLQSARGLKSQTPSAKGGVGYHFFRQSSPRPSVECQFRHLSAGFDLSELFYQS